MVFLFLLTILSCVADQTQSSSTTRITSHLSEGKVAAISQKPRNTLKIKPSQILRETVSQDRKGRRTVMRVVEAPDLPLKKNKKDKKAKNLPTLAPFPQPAPDQSPLVQHHLTVTATTYDKKFTRLKVWSHAEGEAHAVEAWSNVDWNHLTGFVSFEGRGHHFTFFLLHSNESLHALRKLRKHQPTVHLPRIPKQIRNARRHIPQYYVTSSLKDEEKRELALEFLESIHDLYAEKKTTLAQAHRLRQQNKRLLEEELRRNPPEKEEVLMTVWDNTKNARKNEQ